MRAAVTLALLAVLLATPVIAPAAERGRNAASPRASDPPPVSRPLPASGTCPRGYALVGDPSRRARCFATRPSRIWYRLALDADYAQSSRDPSGTTVEASQHWRFDSAGAVILFAQCTPSPRRILRPGQLRIAAGISARVACGQQTRFLGLDLVSDVSFSARGTAVGGRYQEVTTRLDPFSRTTWRDLDGGHDFPCPGPFTHRVDVTGPQELRVTLSTGDDQTFNRGGLGFHDPGPDPIPGVGVDIEEEHQCVKVPPEVPRSNVISVAYRAPVIQERTLTGPMGTDLLGRFRPRIGGSFGRRVIRLAQTVGPVGQSGRSARFALTLTRCPARRGRSPEGCSGATRGLPVAAPSALAAPRAGDRAKVARFLRGRRVSTFRAAAGDPPSTLERHYDFCPRGRVRYESTFLNTELKEPAIDVRTGRWRVGRARISNGFGTARIGLVADTGERGAVLIEASPRGFRLGGEIAEVTSSPVCGRG
jgi:hypothetical protein